MITRPEFIDADWTDYSADPNFAPTGIRIAWKTGPSVHDLKWSRVYSPSTETLEWDAAPEGTNAAIGNRRGWSYATIKVTGRDAFQFIPGATYNEFGVKVRLTFATWDFESGTHIEGESVEAWVAIEDEADRVEILKSRRISSVRSSQLRGLTF